MTDDPFHLTHPPAIGLNPDKTLSSEGAAAGPSTRSAPRINAPVDIAGGQNWRLATAGGDNNVRVRIKRLEDSGEEERAS